jgi:hypothetical protein
LHKSALFCCIFIEFERDLIRARTGDARRSYGPIFPFSRRIDSTRRRRRFATAGQRKPTLLAEAFTDPDLIQTSCVRGGSIISDAPSPSTYMLKQNAS